MSLMASFCAILFPRDVMDEIWDLIVSVSEDFPTYLAGRAIAICLLYYDYYYYFIFIISIIPLR